MVSAKRTRHSVYDLKYHFVWVPKYRKLFLEEEIGDNLEKILKGVADRYDIEIGTLEVMPDHVHLFGSAPPKYSPSKVVQIMKSISARKLFERYPKIREKL
ncbi:IS200/IS605 family transposase [Candidatus Bipolaricaulota bacterium]|nr:IS200/IS605 family transposase [Candidatus Bipolaricaulota bacterium]